MRSTSGSHVTSREEVDLPADRRLALVVANADYDDEALGRLASPARDAAALTRVLEDPSRCDFEVATVLDGSSGEVVEAVESFLAEVERSDLLLLYFSCHGLKDEHGRLYFAARNTRRDRLRSTAVSATLVNELLLGSRSRRKVLMLDCCYGGAFAKGLQVKADRAVHTADHFDARGLVVLTASDATQYAFDGETVRGDVTPSRFTAVLVDGLASGEADLDRDGLVSVDDAYDFVRLRLGDEGVPQAPRKWEFDVSGHIVLARTEASAGRELESAVPRPPQARPAEPRAARSRAWWLSALGLAAGATAVAWLAVAGLADVLYNAAPAEDLPNRSALSRSLVGLAAAWAVAYVVVAHRRGVRPWEPLVAASADLFGANGARRMVRGLVSALPFNVLIVGALTVIATGNAYQASGSEMRDNVFRLSFAVLAIAGLARYLTRELVGSRRGRAE